MFDKNNFKEAFRSWMERHPQASAEDALNFCQNMIPASVYASHYWLVEQSLAWFSWLAKNRTQHTSSEDFQDGDDSNARLEPQQDSFIVGESHEEKWLC